MAAVERTPTPIASPGRQNFIQAMEDELRRVQEHLDRRYHRRRSSGLNGTVGGEPPVHIGSVRVGLSAEEHRRRNDHPYYSSPYKWNAVNRNDPARPRTRPMSQGESPQMIRVSCAQDAVQRSPPLRELSSTSHSNTPSTDSLLSPEPEAIQSSSPRLPLSPSTLPSSSNSAESFPATSNTDSSRERSLSPQAIHHSRSKSISENRSLPPSISPPPLPTLSASQDDLLNTSAVEEGTWPRRKAPVSKAEQRHRYSELCQHKTLMVNGRQVHQSMMRVRVKKENATLIRAETTASICEEENQSPSSARKRAASGEKRLSSAERNWPAIRGRGMVILSAEMSTKRHVDLASKRSSEGFDQEAKEKDNGGTMESAVQEEKDHRATEEADDEIRADNSGRTGKEIGKTLTERGVGCRAGDMGSRPLVEESSHPESEDVDQRREDANEEERGSVAEVNSQPTKSSKEGGSHKSRAVEQEEDIRLQHYPTMPTPPRPHKEAQGLPTVSPIQSRSHKEAELEELVGRLKAQLRHKHREKLEADEIYRKELRVHEERIKKLNKDNARLEREKWELLRRAREAAERSVNLRTKLDLHDSALRSTQQELQCANDELSAVRSANNSLRLLVTDLRTPTPKSDIGIQVELVPISPPSIPLEPRRDSITPHSFAESESGGALRRLSVDLVTSDDWEGTSLDSSQADSRDGTPTATPQMDRRGREKRSMQKFLSKFRRSSSSGHPQNSTASLGEREGERETVIVNNAEM